MAGPMTCDHCGEPAAFIIGNVQNGEQLAVCGPDAGRWGLALALSQLEVTELLDMLDAIMPAPPEPVPAQEQPRPPRTRRRKPAPEGQDQDQDQAPEIPAAATAAPD